MQNSTHRPSKAMAKNQPPAWRVEPEPRSVLAPIDSTQLLRGSKVVDISHNGKVYRLHATRLGKLILTL